MGLIGRELGRVCYVTATTVGGAQTLYTNLTTEDTIITHITMHNTDSSAIIVTLCVVDGTGSADINDEIWQQSIDASDTATFDVPIPIVDTNYTMKIYADTIDKINSFCFGVTLGDQS